MFRNMEWKIEIRDIICTCMQIWRERGGGGGWITLIVVSLDPDITLLLSNCKHKTASVCPLIRYAIKFSVYIQYMQYMYSSTSVSWYTVLF